jgi:uncharacterized protein YqgV (UPF0045/DUF77 family)
MEHTPLIQATVAVYPLQQTGYEAVHRAIDALRSTAARVDAGPMHTTIAGDEEVVFRALQAAFKAATAMGPTVMTVTVSNACPTA